MNTVCKGRFYAVFLILPLKASSSIHLFTFYTNFLSFIFRDEVEDFFEKMDRDFDGRLSFEEFMGEESTIGKNTSRNL